MNEPTKSVFQPLPAERSAPVSWIHLGDLHMTRAGEQNEVDLGRIVEDINSVYASGGINFVFLPGDIADDGSSAAYEVVRSHLDRLRIPWCGIVGDHDVHEKSFANFERYIAHELYSGFTVGDYRFLRLNAFSEPRPDAFIVSEEQLTWLEGELQSCEREGTRAVLLLHCYPSDLKQGGDALTQLVHRYPVLLIDMGHTHYNEISNDGTLLYTATRSTGQIEEGRVGFSVITLDGGNVSWHFVEAGSPELVNITSPTDRRLCTSRGGEGLDPACIDVRARIWSRKPMVMVEASIDERTIRLQNEAAYQWAGQFHLPHLSPGEHRLSVTATTEAGNRIVGWIDLLIAGQTARDRDNTIGAWTDRGILGARLGPNENGRKW